MYCHVYDPVASVLPLAREHSTMAGEILSNSITVYSTMSSLSFGCLIYITFISKWVKKERWIYDVIYGPIMLCSISTQRCSQWNVIFEFPYETIAQKSQPLNCRSIRLAIPSPSGPGEWCHVVTFHFALLEHSMLCS